MITTTLDITEAILFKTLGDFMAVFLPGVTIIQGQSNRVASPPLPFIVMTPMRTKRLSTGTRAYTNPPPTPLSAPGVLDISASWEWGVQLDFHGDTAQDMATTISIMFRTPEACTQFSTSGYTIQPLYADEAKQLQFTNDSAQYEDRWSLDAVIQFNPTLALAQQFAQALEVGLINVEATYG